MWITFHKGISNEDDLKQINALDKAEYSDKYLLDIKEYKSRLRKNPDQIYVARNSKRNIIAYTSLVPLKYKCYKRLKNGEVDKDVITPESIIAKDEKIENVYWDSIIVHPLYREQNIGERLSNYAIHDLVKSNPDLKRLLAHTISNGGLKVAKKHGLIKKRKLDNITIIVEKEY